MRTRWLRLAAELDIGGVGAEEIWRALKGAYGANGRFYHTLEHIQYALDIADQLRDVAVDFTAVQLAIWFHDVVYDPRRNDNEAHSAALAERKLRPLGVPDETLRKVTELILATQNHEPPKSDPDFVVILDADLAILSAPPDQYDAYARAIRQEYSFVPEEAYVVGRTAVLQKFLARSPFYFTEKMQVWGDTAVNQNVRRELKMLSGEQKVL